LAYNLSRHPEAMMDKPIDLMLTLKYVVEDTASLLLEVNNAKDALSDMTNRLSLREIVETDWLDCNVQEIESRIKRKCKSEAKKWGISVYELTLTDLGLMRSILLMNSKTAI
jgi:uncharacterized membrane protein YheB (UPF0754 family)